jgi:hypothetical protein
MKYKPGPSRKKGFLFGEKSDALSDNVSTTCN